MLKTILSLEWKSKWERAKPASFGWPARLSELDRKKAACLKSSTTYGRSRGKSTVAGVTSLAYLAVCNFHAASWTAFQLFCGRLPVAAGSLNLAGCALACALFMELADYSRCVASDLFGEVCLRYRKSFPAVTVFHSILRIAKWRATPQGNCRQSWWSAPIARTTENAGVCRVHATAESRVRQFARS